MVFRMPAIEKVGLEINCNCDAYQGKPQNFPRYSEKSGKRDGCLGPCLGICLPYVFTKEMK